MTLDLPINQIISEEYTPADATKFEELKQSIEKFGLFHGVLVQGKEPPYKLIIGKARFHACLQLGKEKITATIIEQEGDLRELSLEENLKRNNLAWYEQVELYREFHQLKIQEHGKQATGRPSKDAKKGWGYRDTAQELGVSLGALSSDLQLAEALAINPNLRLVKDKTTATRLIKAAAKRIEAQEKMMELPTTEMNQVYLGEASSILSNLEAETFDLCVTDPPWTNYKDTELIADEFTTKVFSHIYRLLKKDGFLFMFVGGTDFINWCPVLRQIGFSVQTHPLIWHKTHTITQGRRHWEYARDIELIILAVKGSPVLVSPNEVSCVLTYKNLHSTKLIHPHEKPIDLIKQIITDATFSGAKVLDPFAGSGVTGQACIETGRFYVLCEREKKFYDNIVERLNAAHKQELQRSENQHRMQQENKGGETSL